MAPDPKILLLDVDGVLILGAWFSQRIAAENTALRQDLTAFFANQYRDCAFGRGDIKHFLAPILRRRA